MHKSEIPRLISSSGLCTLCQEKAVWICQRCMDFYCSPECQRKDWQRHRYICFAMPGLIPACHINSDPIHIPVKCTYGKNSYNEQFDSFSRAELRQPKGCKSLKATSINEQKSFEPVTVLGFISSNICFVRLLKDTEAHTSTLKKIDTIGREAPLLDICRSTRTEALTLYNGMLSRVEVLSIRDQRYAKVLFCDYGIVKTVKISDLRVASEDILKLPRYTIMVKLHNVNDYSTSENLTNFLKKFEGVKCQMHCCLLPMGEEEVELYALENQKNINEEIGYFCSKIALTSTHTNHTTNGKEVEKCEIKMAIDTRKCDVLLDLHQDSPNESKIQMAIPSKCENITDHPILTPPFEIYLFNSDLTNFKVVVLDTSALNYGYIGCIAETDLKYLVHVQEYLSRYKDNKQYYSPKLHEYCLARFENEWYRARVVKVNDPSHYTVVYLDFTNESVLTSQDIRRYPVDLNGTCRTNLCLIDGLPTSLKVEHVNFLKKEITTESKLLINKVKEVVQQIVVVECQHIIKKMSDLNLI